VCVVILNTNIMVIFLLLKKQVIAICLKCVAYCITGMCICRPEELPGDFYKVNYEVESAVKRKTLLKNGKKPSVRTCTVLCA